MRYKGGLKLALVLALVGASLLISQIVFSSPSLAQTSSKTGYKVEGTVVRMVNNKNQAVSDVKVNIDYYDKTAKKNKTSTQTTSKGLFGKNAGKFTFPKIDTGSVRVYSTNKDCLFTQTFNLTKKDNRTYTCNPNATTLNQKSQLGTEGPIYMSISGGVKDVDGPRGSDNQPLQGVPNATVFFIDTETGARVIDRFSPDQKDSVTTDNSGSFNFNFTIQGEWENLSKKRFWGVATKPDWDQCTDSTGNSCASYVYDVFNFEPQVGTPGIEAGMVHFFFLVSNNPPLTIKFDHPTQGEVYEVGVDKPIVWDVYKGNEPAPDYELAKINSFNIFCDPDGKGYKVYIAKPVLKADVTASDKYAYNWKPCVTGNSVKIKIEGITNGQPGRIIAKGESSAFKVQIGAVSITPGFNFGNDPGFSWHNIKSRIDILNGLFKASPPFDELIQAETVQTLENGNYFNLKTMDNKRNFLNSNITDSSIRNAIINIESNNNWNINTTNVPELSNGSSVDYSDSMIDLAAQYANKLDWYNKKARINCPNNQKPFLEKTCWDGNGLNFIYSNYFSYLAEENKSKIKFDDEITLLERMYNETAGFNLIQQDPINDTDQGTINAYKLFFGDSPIWLAALSFVPAERLLLPVARAGQLLCRVGDGVAKGLTLGLKRKTNRIALLLHEINLPSLGTFNININEIARHSWLSAKTIKGIVNDYAIILDDWVGDDLFSRWMTKEEAIIALKDNTFIDGWRQFNLFINDKYMCFKASGYCTWSGSIHIHDTIYGMIDSAGTYRHEMGHYISNPIDEVDGWLHYSKPLNEGHTEFLTQQLAKRTGKPVSWLSKSYGKEVSLTQDIFDTLQAKNRALGLPSATDDILQIMGDGYFRDGIDVYLDYQLDPYTPDASSVFGTIVNFTDAGDYRGASNYLKSIRTYMNW